MLTFFAGKTGKGENFTPGAHFGGIPRAELECANSAKRGMGRARLQSLWASVHHRSVSISSNREKQAEFIEGKTPLENTESG